MSGAVCQQSLTVRPEAAALGKMSLIVPCHNETESLANLKSALTRLCSAANDRWDLELLLIDDASTDDTAAVMKELFAQWDNVTILRHETRRGIAGAIGTGLKQASAEVIASLDADCTYDPSILLPMARLLTDGVDVVVASPYHPDGRVESVPAWRLCISRCASRMYAVVMRNKLHTYTSCVRIYRRKSVNGLPVRNQGFVGIVELLWHVDRRGGKIVEYPAVLRSRTAGKSKMRVARAAMAHLNFLSRAFISRMVFKRG